MPLLAIVVYLYLALLAVGMVASFIIEARAARRYTKAYWAAIDAGESWHFAAYLATKAKWNLG